jgi:hypothetical protein
MRPRAASERMAVLTLLDCRSSADATSLTLRPGWRTSSRIISSSECGSAALPGPSAPIVRGSSQARSNSVTASSLLTRPLYC